MNRHITKILDDKQREKDNSSSPPPCQPTYSSPESSPPTNGYPPALYVDVVKNMPKLEIPTPPPPHEPTPPEFSLFREDFPALPGTARSPSSPTSTIPDDWKTLMSDGEPDEFSKFRDIVMSSDTNSSTSDFKGQEYLPQLFGYLPSPTVSLIFGQQFLHEGVRQRALRNGHKKSQPSVHPPPGFEKVKMYARLNTNYTGMPFGGVNFELESPLYDRMWRMENSTRSAAVEGSFGMLGLAGKLESLQRNPLKKPNLFADDVQHNVEPGENSWLHFAGARDDYNVPLNYRLAGKLGLPQPKTGQMHAELLFFFFYMYTGDLMQLLAAAELAERGWRYHTHERIWIKRQADNPNYSYHGFQESGEYNYFNMCQWKILRRHFQLDPDQLERTLTKMELYEMHGYHPQM
ncbi:probable NOT transcription complex subunit VIP2 [Drosophila elegans]|uniref:probable NOT transcription complex subunit VIP2 n=1 Tax=Drosophila elegans TaxID=30023 RepID=UPI0007E7300A|nr:probable NOT transcription complex subunit VIP2 [Drosophila elegans]